MGYTYLFSVDVFIIFGYRVKNGIAGSYGSCSFSFLKNLHTIYIVATPVYVPITIVQGFRFLNILPNICYLWVFWW